MSGAAVRPAACLAPVSRTAAPMAASSRTMCSPARRAPAVRAALTSVSDDARAQPLLLGMALERQRNQAIEQGRIGKAAGFPHLRIHRDSGEAGNGVHLVDEEPSAAAVEEEVHAGHAGQL